MDDGLLEHIVNQAEHAGRPEFEVIAPTVSFSIMGMTGKNKGRAYLVPDHVHGTTYYWWVVQFLKIEFYEAHRNDNKFAAAPFQVWEHLGIEAHEIGNGLSILDASLERIEALEGRVTDMNQRGYLSLLATHPGYTGPLSCESCRLVRKPDFASQMAKGFGS